MDFLLFVAIIGLVWFFIKKYNLLQAYTQGIKESRSNITVALEQKVAIVNQFVDVVNNYGNYEKVFHLNISENYLDMAKSTSDAMMTIQNLANTYPELKASDQYKTFLDQISANEELIAARRSNYNGMVRIYNSEISQIPMVFVASLMGFNEAPYFDSNNESNIHTFAGASPEAIKELAIKGKDALKEKIDEQLQQKGE